MRMLNTIVRGVSMSARQPTFYNGIWANERPVHCSARVHRRKSCSKPSHFGLDQNTYSRMISPYEFRNGSIPEILGSPNVVWRELEIARRSNSLYVVN